MQVQKLARAEKERTRKLYEEAFPEDSARMRDFYYATRMQENTVYAIRNEQEVEGMLCLNPCRVQFGKEEQTLSYIVAVATGQKYRRRGIMRRILTQALRDEYAAGKPFVFLEPANPAYYTPFQFTYASRREKHILKNDSRYHCRRVDVQDEALLQQLAARCNELLAQKYQIFCLRSPDYLRRLHGELSAGGGRMLSVWERQNAGAETLIGMESFDDPDTREQDARLILPDTATLKRCGTEPFIMARILSLPAFFAGVTLRDHVAAEERALLFSLKDPLIEENNGIFVLHTTREGSRVERLKALGQQSLSATPLTPEELIAVFFGMKRASWAEELTVRRAYFDEEL